MSAFSSFFFLLLLLFLAAKFSFFLFFKPTLWPIRPNGGISGWLTYLLTFLLGHLVNWFAPTSGDPRKWTAVFFFFFFSPVGEKNPLEFNLFGNLWTTLAKLPNFWSDLCGYLIVHIYIVTGGNHLHIYVCFFSSLD